MDEKTSEHVATIASKVMRGAAISFDELRSLAASALTQTRAHEAEVETKPPKCPHKCAHCEAIERAVDTLAKP